MSTTTLSTAAPSPAVRLSTRHLRMLRVVLAALTLVALLAATVFVLPSAGLLLFLAGLALLFALPFATVTVVVDGLDPAE